MRAAAASLLALVAAFAKPVMSCVELQGIVPGGGEGLLDLTFLLTNESIGTHPFAPLDTLVDPPIDIVSFPIFFLLMYFIFRLINFGDSPSDHGETGTTLCSVSKD